MIINSMYSSFNIIIVAADRLFIRRPRWGRKHGVPHPLPIDVWHETVSGWMHVYVPSAQTAPCDVVCRNKCGIAARGPSWWMYERPSIVGRVIPHYPLHSKQILALVGPKYWTDMGGPNPLFGRIGTAPFPRAYCIHALLFMSPT